MDILVVSTFWLLAIMLLWTFVYRVLCGRVLSIFRIARSYGRCNLLRNCQTLPKWLHYCHYHYYYYYYYFILTGGHFFIAFRERGRERREGGTLMWEGNIDWLSSRSHRTKDQTYNLGRNWTRDLWSTGQCSSQVSHNGQGMAALFYKLEHCMRTPVSPHPCQLLLLSVFLVIHTLVGVQ